MKFNVTSQHRKLAVPSQKAFLITHHAHPLQREKGCNTRLLKNGAYRDFHISEQQN